MYAVFKTGGKQYYVTEGQIIDVERLYYDIQDLVEFNQILLIKDNQDYVKIGNPMIKGGKVIAKIILHSLKKKVKIVKFRRRKHSCKHQGHRQYFTKMEIIRIESN